MEGGSPALHAFYIIKSVLYWDTVLRYLLIIHSLLTKLSIIRFTEPFSTLCLNA